MESLLTDFNIGFFGAGVVFIILINWVLPPKFINGLSVISISVALLIALNGFLQNEYLNGASLALVILGISSIFRRR